MERSRRGWQGARRVRQYRGLAMPLKNYYAILEVPRHATLTQIKQSYRRLARLYHPDLNKQIHDDRIKQLNEAYDVLSDTARRLHYDIVLLEEMRNALILE